MEKLIKVKSEYSSLDGVLGFLKKESPFTISKDFDHWELRTDGNGQMEKCIVIKKSNMHGVKAHFSDDSTLKVSYIIPNKMMNAYFGKSQKARKNIIEIIAGTLKSTMLASSQKKAFDEITKSLNKIEIK